MKCTKCGTNNPADQKFCGECGNKLEKLCSACGEPVVGNAQFCLNCGEYLAFETEQSNSTPSIKIPQEYTNTHENSWLRTKLAQELATDLQIIQRRASQTQQTSRKITASAMTSTTASTPQSDWDFCDATFETQVRDGQTVSILRKVKNLKKGNIVIPSKDPQGYPIVEISKAQDDKTGGVFCDEVKLMDGQYETYICTKLLSVTIAEGITNIGEDAFQSCESLAEISLPESVLTIGESAFSSCSSLNEILLPTDLASIGPFAFHGCKKLNSLTIPDATTYIGANAFGCCNNLESVTIWGKITSIETGTFSLCKNLRYVHYFRNCLTSIGQAAFEWCDNLASFDIPDSVTSIGKDAFTGCGNLSSLTIPASVKSIGKDAFSCCFSLYSIKFLGTRAAWDAMGSKAYFDIPDRTRVTCSDDSTESYSSATTSTSSSGGCYVATCVYGSYDCPQVWTLRRFRDDTLGATWYGRAFIRAYYAISPTLVKWLGKTSWFKRMWQGTLDKMVAKLNNDGVADTPYQDRNWK